MAATRVRTVETAQATIRFMGGVTEDSSDSSSEEDEALIQPSSKHKTTLPVVECVDDHSSLKKASDEHKTLKEPHNEDPSMIITTISTEISDALLTPNASVGTETKLKSKHDELQQTNDTHYDGHDRRYDEPHTRYDDHSPLANDFASDQMDCAGVGFKVTNEQKLSKMGSNDSGFSSSSTRGLDESSPRHECDEHPGQTQETGQANCASPQSDGYNERLTHMKQHRFNPFDTADLEVQDPFPQLDDIGPRISDSLRDPCDDDDADLRPIHNEIKGDIGFTEDHYSQPEGHVGLSSVDEIQLAILHCKQLVMQTTPQSERMKSLVAKLVNLRMKLAEADADSKVVDPEVKVVVGHQFKARSSRSAKHYCEKCNSVIWGVLHERYKCIGCGFNCHEKCMNLITRTCAAVKVKEDPTYILSICPEKGLAAQKYRCADCRSPISFQPGHPEPRQCDYNGLYYCEICHWNDMVPVPARILHNWDFEPVKVCRASKQFLKLMSFKAVLRIQDINPMLFNFVDELSQIKKFREEILIMKKYFMSCKSALESKLLLQLSERQHFVENSDMYTEMDLADTVGEVLLPQLAKIHTSFAQHIKTDCQVCQGKGFICEMCDDMEVLFPFDNIAIVCARCSTVLHRHCFMRKNQKCPRCQRLSQRQPDFDTVNGTQADQAKHLASF